MIFQSFTRPLVSSDWVRFEFYAKRMRYLSFHLPVNFTLAHIAPSHHYVTVIDSLC